jgi:hypothetical protein
MAQSGALVWIEGREVAPLFDQDRFERKVSPLWKPVGESGESGESCSQRSRGTRGDAVGRPQRMPKRERSLRLRPT